MTTATVPMVSVMCDDGYYGAEKPVGVMIERMVRELDEERAANERLRGTVTTLLERLKQGTDFVALRAREERRDFYDYGQGWHDALDAVERGE